ncbi:MAG TPA: hypothetical protein VGC84_12875 [Ilumatobacteraceae bacterium]
MSNDELPPNTELASAYLDGEVDAGARAAVEATPGLSGVIDSFARVRAAVGDVPAVSDNARNAAIDAALAHFDVMNSAGRPATASDGKVLAMRSRRERIYRVVTGVAAALVVGFVAISAVNSSHGSDSKSSSAATIAPTAAASEASTPQLKAAVDVAGATAAGAGTAAPAAGSDSAAQTQIAAAEPRVIDSTTALAEFAASVEPRGPVGGTTPSANTQAAGNAPAPGAYGAVSCITSDQHVLGPIVYKGNVAFAVRNTSTGVLEAIDAANCRVLDQVPPDTVP